MVDRAYFTHLLTLFTYLLTHSPTYFNYLLALITHSLTPWSKVHLEKLIGFQLVKKFTAFYGT